MSQAKRESPYFESRVFVQQNMDGTWIGRTRFIRKDTGEEVGCGKTLAASTRKELETNLHKEAKAAVRAMKRPVDWKSKARLILARYLMLRDYITKFGGVLDAIQSGSIEAEDADEEYVKFWNLLVDETIALAKEIVNLTELERRELLLSPDFVFENPTDPWNLDDLSGREGIFRFFLAPSLSERHLHDEQVRRMKLAFTDPDGVEE